MPAWPCSARSRRVVPRAARLLVLGSRCVGPVCAAARQHSHAGGHGQRRGDTTAGKQLGDAASFTARCATASRPPGGPALAHPRECYGCYTAVRAAPLLVRGAPTAARAEPGRVHMSKRVICALIGHSWRNQRYPAGKDHDRPEGTYLKCVRCGTVNEKEQFPPGPLVAGL